MGSDATPGYLSSAGGNAFVALLRALRERPRRWVPHDDYDQFLLNAFAQTVKSLGAETLNVPWSRYGQVTMRNPLASLGASFWNGPTIAGNGDGYSVRVQTTGDTQSFRAVWEVGNWDAGGITIPAGESGEPASAHYADLTEAFTRNRLVAMPYSAAAVNKAAKNSLVLSP